MRREGWEVIPAAAEQSPFGMFLRNLAGSWMTG
jgi:hypothetical protein